jgi:hypothetical protein
MPALWRRTSFALALASGLGLSQAPEFAQQYRQRLGGAIDELSKVVAAFDADSQGQGLSHDAGLTRLGQSEDVFVRQRGERIAQETERLARLRRQSEFFASGAPLASVWGAFLSPDAEIARGALGDFKPAAPLTADGGLCAGFGFLVSLLLLRLGGLPFRRAKPA